jgi:hypothetical protein
MGKTLGKEEIQISEGEFVRSLTNGAVENVPIARNCPVPCKLPTEILLGITVRERRLFAWLPEVGRVTVSITLELASPLNAIAPAVMVVVPAATPVTRPEALTVATVGVLELQVTPVDTFCVDG